MHGQTSFLEEITIDLFAGGGGASTGAELALGRPIDIAVNHDINAVLMHQMNHPYTTHYCESVFTVDPVKATQGRPVGFMWSSPDCTHFSRAKGGTPVKKEIRGLAWVIVKWAKAVSPRVIMMENVPEFKTWGPLTKDNRPDKKRSGQTFNQFIAAMHGLGYAVEWRVLDASEYGAGTSRKRLYIVMRCDGQPIVWPKPTHGEGLKPKRTAAEFIDFSLRGKSIFNRKKPLAEATQKRIARGLDKFTIKSKKPFLVPVGYGERNGQAPRVNNPDAPLGTIVSTTKHNVVNPYLVECNHRGDGFRGQGIDDQLHTIAQKHTEGIVAAHIQKYFSGGYKGCGSAAGEPIGTVTGQDHNAVCNGIMAPFISSKYGENGANNVRGREVDKPLPTTAASTVHSEIASPYLIQYHSETSENEARAYGLDDPLNVIDTNPRYGIASAHLVNYYSTGHELNIEKPLPTQTTKDRTAYIENHLCVLRNNYDCKDAREPLPTITTSAGHFADIRTYLVKYDASADLLNWPQVRELLNKYASYNIADDEVLILEINGIPHFIGDIEMRMLTPRELYGCQGFPPDYIIDHVMVDGIRKAFPIHEQVKKVGNSVCPPVAYALVKSNLPEIAYRGELRTMQELNKAISV